MAIQTAWKAEAVNETIRPEDEAAIRACLLDYFEGWFDGDPVRMDRALHPLLAKHAFRVDKTRSDTPDVTTRDEMIELTRQAVGRQRDVPDRAIRIEVLAVSGDIASAMVHSAVYVELALLARTREGWRITATLWHWAAGNGPRA